MQKMRLSMMESPDGIYRWDLICATGPREEQLKNKALRFLRTGFFISVLIFNPELDYHTWMKVSNEACFSSGGVSSDQDSGSHCPVLHEIMEGNKLKIGLSPLHSESWGETCSDTLGYEAMNTVLAKSFGMGDFLAFFLMPMSSSTCQSDGKFC